MSIISKLLEAFKIPLFEKKGISTRDNHPFSRVATSGRIIRAYSGFLPCTQYTALHILRCEHLRDISGEKNSPYRADSEYTHQIWIWYRTYKEPQKLYLVFRGQFNFTTASNTSDFVAVEITDFLAHLLLHATLAKQVLRHKHSDIIWANAIETKFNKLGKKYGSY